MILDCDPGIDDALAIILALSSKELELKAVTTTFGNVGLIQTTKNALNVLELCRLNEPPVVGAGSSQPLKIKSLPAREVHGSNGLGNSKLPEPGIKPVADGVGLIISKINSGEVETIIATGPLTNLARAIERDPGIKGNIRDIYIMGGAVFTAGNITPYAEFNFYSDPDAADYVLNSTIEITLISLDVTHKIKVTKKEIDFLREYKNNLAVFVVDIIEHSIGFHTKHRGVDGAYLHDPLAVAIAAAPRLGEYERLSLGVDKVDKRGMVKVKTGKKNVRFVNNVDAEGFLNLFFNRIGGKVGTIENL
ncbi:MAG: nucleoside hydrolase [Candidatus Omnitrophota bacterium]